MNNGIKMTVKIEGGDLQQCGQMRTGGGRGSSCKRTSISVKSTIREERVSKGHFIIIIFAR